MSEETVFAVEIRDFRATDLTSRNRFKDKLRLSCEFDGQKFKTKKELIGGGDVSWKFSWKSEYKIFSYKFLEEKLFRVTCMRSKTEVYGRLEVDLWTCATGPQEHNLPLLDFENKVVGRLNFILEMEEVANVAVIFKQVKLKNLKPAPGTHECNPYLKYTYSKMWPLVVDNRAKAVYSTTQYNTTDPVWTDLPEVRFHATLKELLHESIVLHVTHQGKINNTTLGRCNLLFRTLVDNGKSFKDEDLISFRGPLKVDNAEIEGILVFKFLPKFGQMKPLNVVKKAIHTEKGIFDALPLLPGLPKPKVTVINSESPMEVAKPGGKVAESPSGRQRSQTVASSKPPNLSELKEGELEKESKKEIVEEPTSPFKQKGPLATIAVSEDLITFTPPQLRRQRSASHSSAFQVNQINPFTLQPAPQIQQPSFPVGAPPVVLQPVAQGYPQQAFNPFMQQQQQQGFQSYPVQQSFQPQPVQPTFQPMQQPFQPVPQTYPVQHANTEPTFNPFAPVQNPSPFDKQAPTFNPFVATPTAFPGQKK